LRNKLWLWLLVFLVSLPIVFSVKVELLSSTPQCISCESIYKITPDVVGKSLVIDENTLWFEFRKPQTELMHGKDISTLRNWEVLMQDERLKEWTEQVLKDEGCKETINENGSKENTCNPMYDTVTKSVMEKYWKPIEDKTLSVGKELIIKVQGNIRMNSAVDNVLVLKKENNQYIKYTQYAWWNSSWTKCRVINITNPVNEVLTKFPMPLVFNGTLFANTSFVNGTDIRFIDATDCNTSGTELNYSIYYFNKSDSVKNSTVMVQATIGALATKQIAVYYDNSGASASTSNAFDENYIMVQALCDVNDKTKNAINGIVNSVPFANLKAGSPVTCAYYFDGTNDHINFTNNLLNFNTSMTIEAWFNPKDTGANMFVITKRPQVLYADWIFALQIPPNPDDYQFYGSNTGTSWTTNIINSLYTFSTWARFTFKKNNSNYGELYVNGVLAGTDTTSITGTTSNIISFGMGNSANWYKGYLSDFRLSNVTRSALWMNASLLPWANSFGSETIEPSADNISYIINYSTSVWELSNQSFWINLSWAGGVTDATATKLEYNNTNYSVSLLDNGTSWKRYNTSIIIPLTAGTSLLDENRTFKFHYNFTNTTGTYTTNTSTSLQRVMEVYFFNSLTESPHSVPELSNATLTVNQSVLGNLSAVNWSVVIEFNGTNHTVTTNTLNNETFNYTEFIGVVTTNNTQINHSAYLNLEWNGINASRSGFNPHQHLIQNYFPTISNNGNITEGNNSITTLTILNVSGPFTAPSSTFTQVTITWNGTNYTATQTSNTTWQLTRPAPSVTINTIITQQGWITVGGISTRSSSIINQTVLDAYNLNVSLWDETTNTPFFSIATNHTVKVRIFCTERTVEQTLTANTTAFTSIDCNWNSIRLYVTFGNNTYYRTYIATRTPPLTTLNAYLINLNNATALQKTFQLLNYGSTGLLPLRINKIIGNQTVLIHEEDWDMENKVLAYFIQYDTYLFDAQGTNEEFIATNTDTVKILLGTNLSLEDILTIQEITKNISCNNATKQVTLTWDDVNNEMTSICLKIINATAGAWTVISSNCSNSSTGTLTSAVLANDTSYLAIGNMYLGSTAYIAASCSLDTRTTTLNLGKEGVFWSAMSLLVITSIGIVFSPVAALIMLVPWFVFVIMTGLLAVGWAILIGLLAVVVMLLINLKR